jgi:RNase H-fold protein (predicted Holliday junction resolvase)
MPEERLRFQDGQVRKEQAMPTEEVVLAVDPGSAKCGVAVVRKDGRVLFRAIVTPESLQDEVRALLTNYRPCAVLVGMGTGSKPLLRALEGAGFSVPIQRVDEAHTSEAARTRFVAENPPRGWQKLLPKSLRTPDRAYDDYVAVILAERFWQRASNVEPEIHL